MAIAKAGPMTRVPRIIKPGKKNIAFINGELVDAPEDSFHDIPHDKWAIEALANEFYVWSLRPEIFELSAFPLERGYSHREFFSLAEKNAKFAKAVAMAREIKSNKLQKMWRDDPYKQSYVKSSLRFVSDEFKEDEDAQRIAKNGSLGNNTPSSGSFTVILPAMPSSDLVPQRSSTDHTIE